MDDRAPERILVIDGSASSFGPDGRASVGLVEHRPDGLRLLGEQRLAGRGAAERLVGLLPGLLGERPLAGAPVQLICAATGPGSFTGLRASLSLAHGLAIGWDVPLHGVPAGCALREAAGPDGPPLWCAIEAGAGRIYLQRPGEASMQAVAVAALAPPAGPAPNSARELAPALAPTTSDDGEQGLAPPAGTVRVAGDAAPRLAARFTWATDTLVHHPGSLALVAWALERRAAGLALLPARPLYGEPPRVSVPARPPRPPPA